MAWGEWRKSRRCPHESDCVEVGHGDGLVGVRDSKDGGRGPVLGFAPEEWQEFATQLAGQPAVYPGPDHPYQQDATDWWSAGFTCGRPRHA